jgi:hypothetical protein
LVCTAKVSWPFVEVMVMPGTISSACLPDVGREAEPGISRPTELPQTTHPLG